MTWSTRPGPTWSTWWGSTPSCFGWDLQGLLDKGLLEIIHISPIELDVDEHVYNLTVLVRERKIKRLVMDSITTFEIGMDDKTKYTDFLWGLTDYFKTQGVSVILLNENPDLFSLHSISKHGISYVSDNIVLLQYLMEGLNIRRLIGVLKM